MQSRVEGRSHALASPQEARKTVSHLPKSLPGPGVPNALEDPNALEEVSMRMREAELKGTF